MFSANGRDHATINRRQKTNRLAPKASLYLLGTRQDPDSRKWSASAIDQLDWDITHLNEPD